MQLRTSLLIVLLPLAACADSDAPPAQRPSPPSVEHTAMSQIEFTPSDVQLDFGSGEMRIRGTLVHKVGPTPSRVWVWAYFFNPQV